MSVERVCEQSGLLVDGDTRLLTDPSEYFHHSTGVQAGCGRLRCESCKAWVRGGPPGLRLARDKKVDLSALHAAPDWAALPFIEEAYVFASRVRLYACTCRSWLAESVAPIDNDHEVDSDPDVPWACAGHPAPELPLSLNELRIDAATNWTQLVDEILRGSCPRDLENRDALGAEPALWLAWLYTYLRGLSITEDLSSAIANRLDDADPLVVGRVLYFFTRFPRAQGIEKVIAKAEADVHRVALGYPIPEFPPAITLWGAVAAAHHRAPSEHDALDARIDALAKQLLVMPRSSLPHEDVGPTAAIEFERQRKSRHGWDADTLKYVLDDFARLRNSEREDVIGTALDRSYAVFRDEEMRKFVADHVVEIDRAAPGRWRHAMTLLSDRHDKPAQGHLIVVAGARVVQARLATADELRDWIKQRRSSGWVHAAWVEPLEAMIAENLDAITSGSMAVPGDTSTFVTAAGPRATRTVPNVDTIEPELAAFVRSAARWLDPDFPQTGTRGERVKGGWKDDQQVETEFTQVEEVTSDGRGIRILRLYRMTEPGPPWEGAIRVIALGAANGARLEVRWNFIANESEIRGTSAELTVEGPRHTECVADFQSWFETAGN